MKTILIPFLLIALTSWKFVDNGWITQKGKSYNLTYTSADKKNLKEYNDFLKNGMIAVQEFFGSPYQKKFDVIIHPGRRSLDSTWQKDWNMPGFKSECWMVASGIATKLDMISPKMWDKESCEHTYGETKNTRKLITHELVHVYHGQLSRSPDFSEVEEIDWFVEGLATYASGQCDASRMAGIRKAISENRIPNTLDNFWKGKEKYGLSGSMVMFIDSKYGRGKLTELLAFTKKSEILAHLKTTETMLLSEWKDYMQKDHNTR